MTHTAQDLDICGICSHGRSAAMRFFVVPLQIVCARALFATATFSDNLRNGFSTRVRAFAGTTIPFWVRFFAHVSPTSCGHTPNRAVLSCTTPPLANLKLLPTLFARTLQQCFWFMFSQFVRARLGACVCRPSNVGIGPCKNFFAGSTSKRCMPATFDCPLELSHG